MKGDEYEEDNHDKDSDGKDPQDETDQNPRRRQKKTGRRMTRTMAMKLIGQSDISADECARSALCLRDRTSP